MDEIKSGFVFIFDESEFSLGLLKGFLSLLGSEPDFHFVMICPPKWLMSFQKYFRSKNLDGRISLISADPKKLWIWLRDLSIVTDSHMQLLKIDRKDVGHNQRIDHTLKLLRKIFFKKRLKVSKQKLEGGDLLFGEQIIPLQKRLLHVDLSLAVIRKPNGQKMAFLADQKTAKPTATWKQNAQLLSQAGIQKFIRIPCTKEENFQHPVFNIIQFGNTVLVPFYRNSKIKIAPQLKKNGLKVISIPCDELSPLQGAVRCRTMEIPKKFFRAKMVNRNLRGS
jgi:hypothetical protein